MTDEDVACPENEVKCKKFKSTLHCFATLLPWRGIFSFLTWCCRAARLSAYDKSARKKLWTKRISEKISSSPV